MKRFHVHVHVDDLGKSIGFYSKLFAAEPARVEGDYAKWMLDDPRINFAISTRGGKPGIDHLGIQTDDADELARLKARAEAADMALLDEGETTCCYARSEKHWVTDPQGIAWEHFHTLDNIPVFSEAAKAADRRPAARRAPRHARRHRLQAPNPAASLRDRHRADAGRTRLALLDADQPLRTQLNHEHPRPDPVHPQLGAQRAGRGHAQPSGRAARARTSARTAPAARRAAASIRSRSRRWPTPASTRAASAARAGTSSAATARRRCRIVITVCDSAAAETCPVFFGAPAAAGEGALGLPRSVRTPKAATRASAAPSS